MSVPSRSSQPCHRCPANCLYRYTRALEERIVDLESQIPDKRPENLSASQQTPTQESPHQRGNETDHDSQASLASRPPYPCSMPYAGASLASPFPHVVEGLPDIHAQCGHSSLLIGILATLTGNETSGYLQTQSESPNAPIFSQFTKQVSQADRVPRLSNETSDRLVQIYLERVNPRYPFLHLATFLGWYESWKSRSQIDRARHQQSLWKDYFVTMVWIKYSLIRIYTNLPYIVGACCCPTSNTSCLCRRHCYFSSECISNT
jgi:hypothetical protein